mgnify:FL=1
MSGASILLPLLLAHEYLLFQALKFAEEQFDLVLLIAEDLLRLGFRRHPNYFILNMLCGIPMYITIGQPPSSKNLHRLALGYSWL